jgi:hypothetical protein
MTVDPVTAWTIAKTAGEISKKLYELGKGLKDRETQQQVDEIVDKLRELEQLASKLEDENRDLREKLRFKSDYYKFKSPFWYSTDQPNQPLCPKCLLRVFRPRWENRYQIVMVGARSVAVSFAARSIVRRKFVSHAVFCSSLMTPKHHQKWPSNASNVNLSY